MLARLGQHIGSVTNPFVNLTPFATSRFCTVLMAQSVLYSWSSVTINRTFGLVGGGGGVGVGEGDGPNAATEMSATNVARTLRARIGTSRGFLGRAADPIEPSQNGQWNAG